MDAAVVRHAKRIPKERKTSVSKIVEDHLKKQPHSEKIKQQTMKSRNGFKNWAAVINRKKLREILVMITS